MMILNIVVKSHKTIHFSRPFSTDSRPTAIPWHFSHLGGSGSRTDHCVLLSMGIVIHQIFPTLGQGLSMRKNLGNHSFLALCHEMIMNPPNKLPDNLKSITVGKGIKGNINGALYGIFYRNQAGIHSPRFHCMNSRINIGKRHQLTPFCKLIVQI